MKQRCSILLLVDPHSKLEQLNLFLEKYHIFPGSRKSNYIELLSGFGFPFDIKNINELKHTDIVNYNTIQYSSILLACPVKNLHSDLLSLLEEVSYEYGISLITDVFMITNHSFLQPFGLKKCSCLRANAQHIKDLNGNTLYKILPYPFSSKGFNPRIRPLLRWIFQSWFSRNIELEPGANRVASFTESHPAIITFPFGKAINCILNFHPSLVLRSANLIHTKIVDTMNSIARSAAVSFDLRNIACLRLDDPGSCERVHLEKYNPGVVSKKEWEALFQILKSQQAHLNISYVPQWVDDGNPEQGTLIYKKNVVEHRTPGKLYNSWEVTYSKKGRHHLYDYAAEYSVIKKGTEEGICTILSHGLTHLSTDIQAWLRAKNRYRKMEWYREFRESVTGKQAEKSVLLDRMKRSADLIADIFDHTPDVLVPSGHEHTFETPSIAREAGYKIFASKAFFLLGENNILRNRKIMAVYPEDIAEGISWVEAGYPNIFVFHDYDIFKNGAGWLGEKIKLLKRHKINQFVSLNNLGVLLMAKIESVQDGSGLEIAIDFSDVPVSAKKIDIIPLKINGIVSSVKVNGEKYSIDIFIDNQITLLSIPFSAVKDSMLNLFLTIKESGE